MRGRRIALTLAGLHLLFPLAGCRTATPIRLSETSGPGWKIQQGQALWRPRHGLPELAGELVLATNTNGSSVIQFSKTPLPLVIGETTPARWFVEFPGRNLSFGGHGKPSARFAWLSLPAAIAGQSLPSALQFQRSSDGGWRLENTRSGETVQGFLTP